MLFIFRSSCTLPPYPDNGRWNLLNGDGHPGEQIPFNSVIKYECDKGYKLTSGFQYRVCDKDWNDSSIRECEMCGKKIDDDNMPLIHGGEIKKVIEYPWVTAVYSKKKDDFVNVCGGTIISQKIVLTAAHCVTNGYGDVMPKENYRVAAGKLYSKYLDSRDPDAQHLELLRIVVHSGYKGENRRFQADIALLITRGLLHSKRMGATGMLQRRKQHTSARWTYRSGKFCRSFPREWANKYAMIDKICAGFLNRNMAVCQGDSGGGLIFKNPEDNRYYIHGVVSIGPALKGECNIQQNSLYTKVAFYYEFLDREISKNLLIEECTLPAYPKNGKWFVQ
ncbi:hypothetical protein NQ318_009094, partial [Aromia moschata]